MSTFATVRKVMDTSAFVIFGMTLMRLSYSFDVSTPTRQRIFESIIVNNGVVNDDGNLYLDTPLDKLYESVLQFAGCAQKVCNMRYWSQRECSERVL